MNEAWHIHYGMIKSLKKDQLQYLQKTEVTNLVTAFMK